MLKNQSSSSAIDPINSQPPRSKPIREPGPWVVVLILTGCGYLAGFNVGKISATLPVIRQELDLSLVLGGTIASSYSLVAMLLSIVLGIIVGRLGAISCVAAGLALIGIAGWLGAEASSYMILLSSRIAEGVGYVLLAISVPILITRIVSAKSRPLAMGVWGTFIPGGVVVSMLAALVFQNQWRPLWWLTCIFAVVCLLTLFMVVVPYIKRQAMSSHTASVPRPALYTSVFARDPLLLAFSFLLYSMFFVTLVTFLPTMLSETSGVSVKQATTVSVFVVLCNIAGNLTGGWLIGRGVPLKLVLTIALVGAGLFSSVAFFEVLDIGLRVGGCLLACYLGGMLPAAVFASIPTFVPVQKNALLLGVVFQALGCGQVLGPITLAAVVENMGNWQYGAVYFIGIALAGFMALFKFQS